MTGSRFMSAFIWLFQDGCFRDFSFPAPALRAREARGAALRRAELGCGR